MAAILGVRRVSIVVYVILLWQGIFSIGKKELGKSTSVCCAYTTANNELGMPVTSGEYCILNKDSDLPSIRWDFTVPEYG